MKNYKCRIISNDTGEREYTVNTTSAYKAAYELGRHELGEVVRVYTMSGRLISEAKWTPELSGKYYRCNIAE